MKPDGCERLLRALRNIDSLASTSAAQWESVIRQAREANLLGTLAYRLSERGLFESVPRGPRAHLRAARIMFTAQELAVRREVSEIMDALREIRAPVIALKGAAYVLADLPPAHGRLFSDIDILVPKPDLPAVEAALMLGGFATTHHHPYDQRYYRRWMHELPPMQHTKRLTVIDVHHAIVPPTARVNSNADPLFRSAVALPNVPGLSVLAPVDMVLHSATHLFHNEELVQGLRDLVDVDGLLRCFGQQSRFFDVLMQRGIELGLSRPLYYAIRWATQLLGSPVPLSVLEETETHAPPAPFAAAMDVLLGNALLPAAHRESTRWARRALYIRAHWLRMPLPLLAWHLTVKSLRREENSEAAR